MHGLIRLVLRRRCNNLGHVDIAILTFVLVLALAFANGTNDVSKAIATLVGSGVTNYRTAIIWGTAWTIVGASASAFVAGAMVKTFSNGLIHTGTALGPTVALAVVSGAMVWVLVASRTGLPVSTTHALTGSIVGAGLAAFAGEGVVWLAIGKKIAFPLLLSPFLALGVSLFLHPAVQMLAGRWEGACLCVMPASRAVVAIDARGSTRTLFQGGSFGQPVVDAPRQCDRAGVQGFVLGLDTIHWMSSGLASFARGTNDAPKIVAMLLLGSATAAWPNPMFQYIAFSCVAIAMGLGSYFGGLSCCRFQRHRVRCANETGSCPDSGRSCTSGLGRTQLFKTARRTLIQCPCLSASESLSRLEQETRTTN